MSAKNKPIPAWLERIKQGEQFKQTHASEVFGEITMTKPTHAENLPVVQEPTPAPVISPEHFEAIKAIGRIETSQFYATVAEKVIAETAIKAKEGKLYKGLPYVDKNGEYATVATFEEYCEAFLGKSYRRVHELVNNYNLLGSELYEQAEQIGFRQRDYNALKALPADDQKIITNAIEDNSADKDKIIDLMQEMAAKHYREKEAYKKETAGLKETHQKETSDLKAEAKAKDEFIKNRTEELKTKNAAIDQLKIDLGIKKAKEESGEILPETALLAALDDATLEITAKIQTTLRGKFKALSDLYPGYPPSHIELAMAQKLGLIIASVRVLADDYTVQPVDEPAESLKEPEDKVAEFLAWNEEQERLLNDASVVSEQTSTESNVTAFPTIR